MAATAEKTEGSQFILRLEGIQLPAAAEKRVAAALQQTLLQELAHLDLVDQVVPRIPRRDWIGIWLHKGRDLPEIPKLTVGVRG